MRFRTRALMLPIMGLAACTQASGSVPDTSNDLHCSVLAYYYSGLAEHNRAPAAQRRAMSAVHEWYAEKVRELARQTDADSVLRQGEPVFEAVKSDPDGMIDEMGACIARSVDDPAAHDFLRTLH